MKIKKRNVAVFVCAVGLSGISSADVLLDQIGADDATDIGYDLTASQHFPDYSVYDIVTMDNFPANGETIVMVETVIDGWNGFFDPSGITSYAVNLYSAPSAASVDLIGDIGSQLVDSADIILSGTWEWEGFNVKCPVELTSIVGTNWVGILPVNSFDTNGQTGVYDTLLGDGIMGWQANPGGAFEIPNNMEEMENEAAYRIHAGEPSNPCESMLPIVCPGDLDTDGDIDIEDLLMVIGSWGEVGDGTFRPIGDLAPLPNGDCMVTIADVLELIAAFDSDCTVFGGCCLGDGTCSQDTSVNCSSLGGVYFGDNTNCNSGACVAAACCVSVNCIDLTLHACIVMNGTYRGDGSSCLGTDCTVVPAGDTCEFAIVAIDGANPFDTTNNYASYNLPVCSEDDFGFGWEEPTNDLWFAWSAPLTADYVIDTCDVSSFDTSIEVLDACDGFVLACNGDIASLSCQQFTSAVLLSATAGHTYLIHIGGYSSFDYGFGTLNINVATFGACCYLEGTCDENLDSATCGYNGGLFMGEGTLCSDPTTCAPPPGDHCSDAIIATLDGPNTFNTVIMTASPELVDETMCAGTFLNWIGSPDAWLVWTATGTGTASFSTCNSNSFDTSVVIYSGSCDNLTQIACNGDAEESTECQDYYSYVADVPVVAGTNYYIRVGAYDIDMVGIGSVTITFNDQSVIGACCLTDGSCVDLLSADCISSGGLWDSTRLCATANCSQPYTDCPTGSQSDCDPCWVSGGNTSTDCNGGLLVSPPQFQAISYGVPICGTAPVYVNNIGQLTRDLDWFTNSGLNAGGTFKLTGGTAGLDLLVSTLDNTTGNFVNFLIVPGGTVDSYTFNIPPGNYSVLVGANDWITDWSCGSTLEQYWVQLDNETAIGACCITGGQCATIPETNCEAGGGAFQGPGTNCSSEPCPQPITCPDIHISDCDQCWVDGDDLSLDCNGGLNLSIPQFQPIDLGEAVCGTVSVFTDSNGNMVRDLDWFSNAQINAGGDFTISGASSGALVWIGIFDNNTWTWASAPISVAGNSGLGYVVGLPAGNYSILVATDNANSNWSCSSGLADYWVQID